MENVSRAIFVGAALVLALTGCQRTDKPVVVGTAERQASVDVAPTTPAAPIPPQSVRDPSLPDTTTALAEQDAEKAKAEAAAAAPPVATPPAGKPMDETSAAQQKAAPQEPMSKEEESKAMPLPSQPNDHSSTALDRNTEK